MITRLWTALLAVFCLLACIRTASAQTTDENGVRYVTYQTAEGTTEYLEDNRRPALYTGNFGDCLGNSLINVTRFDAAYYKDNMTVMFHLQGNSALANESIMMYIGVYAYGESRFDLTFNPCNANINSLCPMNSSIPITANGIIPIAPSDVANIIPIALVIPDFEGEAILRIFANSTESEIGCYSAVVTNGNTFSQPQSVGTILGIFTLVAVLASFATAIYGEAVPTMRLHYAHSLSVGVVFSVFQHIYFTGALSVNWPSVLVAWWSNFAWAGGMIYSRSMQSSINRLIGNNVGNITSVGAAPAGSTQESLGGGYDISQIYKRGTLESVKHVAKRAVNHPLMRDIGSEIYKRDNSLVLKRDVVQRNFEHALQSRDVVANASTGFIWYGKPVGAGIPLPGNYSGFAGTLAEEDIRSSNTFMTGFLWFLILLVIMTGAVVLFKWSLEALARFKAIREDRLAFFRQHWVRYSAAVALRICYLGWFMIMFLTIFQFTYDSSGGVKAVAALVFGVFFVGMFGLAAYAIWYQRHLDRRVNSEGNSEDRKLLGKIPWFGAKKSERQRGEEQRQQLQGDGKSKKSFWKHIRNESMADSVNSRNIHDDVDYTMRFGWLAARFRRTRWWFFSFWLVYEFVRACLYGGASGHALTQVFGLLVVEILAFAFVVWARPFEGRRLNVLVVYCLGFSKVTSVALSAAFDVRFNLARITTTAIGIVIVVIQGILTIITLIAIVVGCISSYMSISRNKEDFRPRKWAGWRDRYFNHLDLAVNDLPHEQSVPAIAAPALEEPKSPYFEMKNMRRERKIEDDDPDFTTEQSGLRDPTMSYVSLGDDMPTPPPIGPRVRSGSGTNTPTGRSRAASSASMRQSSLPFGARQHRVSWSQKDLSQSWNRDAGAEAAFSPVDMSRQLLEDDVTAESPAGKHSRTPSRGSALQNSKLRAEPSNDSLRIGGETSTRDTIGNVPMPAVRPRAGSRNSVRESGASWSRDFGDSSFMDPSEGPSFTEGGAQSASQSRRHTRAPMLTPAQEMEEWVPRVSGSGDQKR
nr:hypothetical protein B0A51_05937 [Rachicladosporium sp. CCFEE 5018]